MKKIHFNSIFFIFLFFSFVWVTHGQDVDTITKELTEQFNQAQKDYDDQDKLYKKEKTEKLLEKLWTAIDYFNHSKTVCYKELRIEELWDINKQKVLSAIESIIALKFKGQSGKAIYELLGEIKLLKKQIQNLPVSELKNREVFYNRPFESSDKSLKLILLVDDKKNIYLKPFDHQQSKIGEGSYKLVSAISQYKTWQLFAYASEKPQAISSLKDETAMLQKIQNVDASEKVGLAQTIATSKTEIIQHIYDTDLAKIYKNSDYKSLDYHFLFQQAIILATGINNLHKNHILHSDIKPENILIDDQGMNHTDVGLSYIPKDFIEQSMQKDLRGTPVYLGPEVQKKKWIGNTNHEKEQNRLKSDVYSLALTSYCLVRNCREKEDPHPSINRCLKSATSFAEYFDCRDQAILEMWEDTNNTFLDYLYLQALNPDVTKRLNSEQFLQGLKYQQEFELNSSNATLSLNKDDMDNLLEKLEETEDLKDVNFTIHTDNGDKNKLNLFFYRKEKNGFQYPVRLQSDLNNIQQIVKEINMYRSIGVEF